MKDGIKKGLFEIKKHLLNWGNLNNLYFAFLHLTKRLLPLLRICITTINSPHSRFGQPFLRPPTSLFSVPFLCECIDCQLPHMQMAIVHLNYCIFEHSLLLIISAFPFTKKQVCTRIHILHT
jgi:hypothetical protein